jgi:redox-sensitive bicupin YhaK (pirin superfamily)
MSSLPAEAPICTDKAGAVELTIEPRERDLGGFSVRRVLPSAKRRMVGPFIFFDQMGPTVFAAGQGIDVRPHPHIGLATVTYLFQGEIMHRDSLGRVQAIRPGAVNWMTAGSGIVHSERTDPERRRKGAALHGIQSWVALPADAEETAPAFHHHPADTLPVIARDGVTMRLIAGSAFGAVSPVTVFSPMFYVDADFGAGSVLGLSDEHEERAIYVVDGSVSVAGQSVAAGTMAIFKSDAEIEIRAGQPARVMLLGGASFGEKRHIWWNFVSSSPERIERAKADWRERRFPAIPGETEFIPLPEG